MLLISKSYVLEGQQKKSIDEAISHTIHTSWTAQEILHQTQYDMLTVPLEGRHALENECSDQSDIPCLNAIGFLMQHSLDNGFRRCLTFGQL